MTIPKTFRVIAAAAPAGFKKAYVEAARDPVSPDVLSMILGLVGYAASAETVERWTELQKVQAFVWACNEHSRASDNIARRCPRPDWLPEPWTGRELNPTRIDEQTPLALPS
jgi:hypothetical protein